MSIYIEDSKYVSEDRGMNIIEISVNKSIQKIELAHENGEGEHKVSRSEIKGTESINIYLLIRSSLCLFHRSE